MNYLFLPVTISFCAATVLFFMFLFTLKDRYGMAGRHALAVGFAFNALYLLIRGVKGGSFPVTNTHEALAFFSLTSVLIFFVFYYRYKITVLGVFLSPLALMMTVIAYFFENKSVTMLPLLQSFWLPIHVTSVFVGNALFALSFVVSIIYLIEHFRLKRKIFDIHGALLPSLTMLDNLNYLCLVYGFPFLTLGLITGAVWAQFAVGSYWNADPKEIWSLITWILYAALLHTRLMSGWRGRKVAIFSIIAFMFLIFSFLGVTLLFRSGYHYNFRLP